MSHYDRAFVARSDAGRLVISLSIVACGLAMPRAHAQESGEPALSEVVITARGREERLQDVSDSVTAFTQADIESRQIKSVQDIAALTPGMLMVRDQDPGTNVITIRGVSANRNQAGSVAYVVDGVALADSEFFTTDLFGIERVEVLKGPQGALYGKNAIGGVINVVTQAPSRESNGQMQVGYGNGDLYTVDGLLSGPLGTERVRALLVGSYRDTDGYIHNNTVGRNSDFYRSTNVRLRVVADLTDALTLDMRANYMDEAGGASWASPYPATALTGGRLDKRILSDPIADYLGSSTRDWRSVSATFSYETEFGTLTATSGYDDYSKFWEGDLDASPAAIVQPVSQPVDLNIFTQELRFSSVGGKPLQWIVGAFFQDSHRERLNYFSRAFPVPDVLATTDAQQIAAFAQASYDFTERLHFLGALRYDKDDRDEVTSIPAASLVTGTLDASFHKWQPKLSLSYDVTPGHMVYATYAVGFKTGGFNTPPEPTDSFGLIYRPESTKSYEVGTKTEWLNGRLIVNAAAYRVDYKDKQEFVLGPTLLQATYSVPQVDVDGYEIEIAARLTDHLKVDAAYGHTDATMKDFQTTNFSGPHDYSGNTTTYTPPYNLAVGGEYRAPLGSTGLTASFRLGYGRVGSTYWEIDNVLYTPSYDWVDARFAIDGEKWSVSAWGRNITDERWATSAFGVGQVASLAAFGYDEYFINAGAQYGMTVVRRFGAGH